MIKCNQILLILLLTLLISFCSKQMQEKTVVASVGDRQITADEFIHAYEFSSRQITQLGREKAFDIILDGLIKESLFADEARERGLLSNSFIENSVNYFERAAINRELYLHHIRDSVFVSDKEIRNAYQKSNTTIFLKHFIATNKNDAEKISKGIISVPHTPLLNNGNNVNIEGIGEVEKISFNEVNQNLENIIYSLPLLQFSKPYYDGKIYHVLRVIDKDINVMTTESKFISKKPSLKSVIRKRKEHHAASQFVNRIMKPQNLIIKAKTLNWMAEIINDEHKGASNPQYLKSKEVQELYEKREGAISKELGIYKSGILTVEDFIEIYRMNPIEVSYKDKFSIRKSLENIVAIYVRNRVFSDIGIHENLDREQSVIDEKEFWEERLLANELKKNILENIKSQDIDSVEVQKKYNQKIEDLVQELKDQTNIDINKKALMAVKTSDYGLSRKIDFFAKHLQ